jgi:Family of unknown function (DUF5522)
VSVPAPHPSRLSPDTPQYDEILARHAAAVQRAEPLYRDPVSGLMVMTRTALLARGQCCERGCRHCPYIASE